MRTPPTMGAFLVWSPSGVRARKGHMACKVRGCLCQLGSQRRAAKRIARAVARPLIRATRFCNPYDPDASQSNPYVSDAKDASNDRNVRIRIHNPRTGEQGDVLGQPDYSQHDYSQLHCPFTKTGTSVPSAMMPVMSMSSVPIIKSTCVAEVFTPWAASVSASMS